MMLVASDASESEAEARASARPSSVETGERERKGNRVCVSAWDRQQVS